MDALEKRVNRMCGQLKGIERMIRDGRSPREVLQQVAAIKSAIDSLTVGLIAEDIARFAPPREARELERVIAKAIRI